MLFGREFAGQVIEGSFRFGCWLLNDRASVRRSERRRYRLWGRYERQVDEVVGVVFGQPIQFATDGERRL